MTKWFIVGEISPVLTVVGLVVLALLIFVPLALGAVLIRERQVGIVVKRFGGRGLEPGHFIALGGEAGYQADTLAPGLYFGYWRWQYRIFKVPVTVVPQGEIALVLAADGAAIPAERILGKIVESDNFQDARDDRHGRDRHHARRPVDRGRRDRGTGDRRPRQLSERAGVSGRRRPARF